MEHKYKTKQTKTVTGEVTDELIKYFIHMYPCNKVVMYSKLVVIAKLTFSM